jgi:hypothetical protein
MWRSSIFWLLLVLAAQVELSVERLVKQTKCRFKATPGLHLEAEVVMLTSQLC